MPFLIGPGGSFVGPGGGTIGPDDDSASMFCVYKIEVDWAGDGSFGNAYSDITLDCLDCQTQRGRDFASQLSGRSTAGKAQITLDNRTGKYSSFNASSAIYSLVLPNRKVRVSALAPYPAVLWTGYLDRIEPQMGTPPQAVLYASGAFRILGDQSNLISPSPQAGVTTDFVVSAILDAAAWPSGGARQIDIGTLPVANWYATSKVALKALQEMEDTELGFLAEGINWDVLFQSRYHRQLTAASIAAQAIFSDAPNAGFPYGDISQQDPIREIYNLITATIQPYQANASTVLWTLQGVTNATIPPGGSISFTATYTNAYASSWVTPLVGTDILQTGVANGDLAVSVTPSATTLLITVTNNNVSLTATLTLVQARGVPVIALNPFQVSAADSAALTAFGKRSYPLPSPWFPNSAYGSAACQLFISRYKDPHPVMTMQMPAGTQASLFQQAVARTLSDRVTIQAQAAFTEMGIYGDFYIESVNHQFGARTPLVTTWDLSPVQSTTQYWQLQDPVNGVLGSTTRLAY